MFIFSSKSLDRFLNPPHLRSDHLDPGREPGRETGREFGSSMTMLGTLRNEGVFLLKLMTRSSIDRLAGASNAGDSWPVWDARAEAGR